MKLWISGLAALCTTLLTPAVPVHAQDSALLDALVKKGVLSNREAEEIQTKEQKDYSTTAASKITMPSSVKNITFYGDLRLRYEQRDGTTPNSASPPAGAVTHDSEDLSRWRYRLRFGIKGSLYDNFFFGIRAATNPNYDRSGNVTFGHSDAAGPFGKDQSIPGIDQVYLGWHVTDDFTLTGGQMPNPLYTTSMIWAEDLNPAGAAEQWDHTFNKNLEVFATAGQFVYQAAAGNGILNGIGGSTTNYTTFMYAEQVGFKYNFDKDTFIKAGATMYTYSGTKGSGVSTVGGLYSDTPFNLSNASFNTGSGAAPGTVTSGGVTATTGQENNSPSFFNGPFVGAANAPLTNVSGINDLAVLEVPAEFDFKIGPGEHTSKASVDPKDEKSVAAPEEMTGWSIPIRIFGDFAYNFEADARADAARGALNSLAATGASNVGVTSAGSGAAAAAANAAMLNSPTFQGVLNSGKGFLDQAAYQIGIEDGQLKRKGDWDGKLFWQSTGYYAVDPNLIDADIFNAATNMQGVVVSVSHNWTDGLASTLRYAYGMPVNDKMATPNVNQDLQIGDIKQYNLFQADLMWKF